MKCTDASNCSDGSILEILFNAREDTLAKLTEEDVAFIRENEVIEDKMALRYFVWVS